MQDDITDEARATYDHYVRERERAERGELAWSELAEAFFTEDAVFVDPAWACRCGTTQAVAGSPTSSTSSTWPRWAR